MNLAMARVLPQDGSAAEVPKLFPSLPIQKATWHDEDDWSTGARLTVGNPKLTKQG